MNAAWFVSMYRGIKKFAILSLVFIGLLTACLVFYYQPARIEAEIIKKINVLSAPYSPEIGSITHNGNNIVFSAIKLDPDSFSSIVGIDVRYNRLTGALDKIVVKDLEYVVQMNNRDFARFVTKADIQNYAAFLSSLRSNIKNLEFQNTKII